MRLCHPTPGPDRFWKVNTGGDFPWFDFSVENQDQMYITVRILADSDIFFIFLDVS